jgi:cytidylate kinase
LDTVYQFLLARKETPMIVSISRELGAGGGTVGEAVAKALGATLLDERTVLSALSERLRLSSEYLEKTVEHAPSLGQIVMSNLARSAAMMEGPDVYQTREEEIIETVRTIVLDHAAKGHVVVIGHGGIAMLGWQPRGHKVLAILLQAGHQWRVEQLARRFSIDLDEARRRIKRTDEARAQYQKYFFHSNMYDCKQYDLALNTERLGLDVAVSLATTAALRCAERETIRVG